MRYSCYTDNTCRPIGFASECERKSIPMPSDLTRDQIGRQAATT